VRGQKHRHTRSTQGQKHREIKAFLASDLDDQFSKERSVVNKKFAFYIFKTSQASAHQLEKKETKT